MPFGAGAVPVGDEEWVKEAEEAEGGGGTDCCRGVEKAGCNTCKKGAEFLGTDNGGFALFKQSFLVSIYIWKDIWIQNSQQ